MPRVARNDEEASLAFKAIMVSAALVTSAAAQDFDTGWRTYVNARFGVSVEYPDALSVRDPEPENGDGQRFRTPDGAASLKVYGSYNVERQSVGELLQAYKAEGVNYVYSAAGRNWFVLSGKKAGTIGYMRCNLGREDVVGCFHLEYPQADAAKWAPIVERMSRSLRLSAARP
jgi:hypothetical protein